MGFATYLWDVRVTNKLELVLLTVNVGTLRYIKCNCISGLPKFYNRMKKIKRSEFLREFKWVFCILEIFLEKPDGRPLLSS
jgi:hypothetical protein